MGGSMTITNKTKVPLVVQLCQVGVLYHDILQPGEKFYRNTGAVHFTIKVRMSENLTKDDTNVFTEGVVAPAIFTIAILTAAFTMGTSLVGTFSAIGPSALIAGGVISSTGVIVQAGLPLAGTIITQEVIRKLILENCKEGHVSLSSAGWYAG